MEDAEIINLFNTKDETAISALSQKYGGLCTTVCKNILHNFQDAEECVNEALLKVWETVPPNTPSFLSAYIAKIAKNIALNRYRLMHREKRGGSEPDTAFEELENFVFTERSVEEEAERKELLEAINGFLEKLPSKKRIIFVRRYWYCDSIADIAASAGMSENNASVTLSRTRDALKKHLQKRGY